MTEELFQGQGSRSTPGIDRDLQARQAVEASIQRIRAATQDLPLGMHTSWNLPTRRQQIGTTCFFSGPISIAEDSGRKISEPALAKAATSQGLLDPTGATTNDPEKRSLMEKFVYEQTGVRIRYDEPRMPEGIRQEVDLRLLKCITTDGNLALLLYPLPQVDQTGYWNFRGEWVTLYAVERTPDDILFHMTFSGTSPNGVIETLNTSQMAKRLYGVPGGHPEIWAIEIQTHYLENSEPKTNTYLFGPADHQSINPELFRPAK